MPDSLLKNTAQTQSRSGQQQRTPRRFAVVEYSSGDDASNSREETPAHHYPPAESGPMTATMLATAMLAHPTRYIVTETTGYGDETSDSEDEIPAPQEPRPGSRSMGTGSTPPRVPVDKHEPDLDRAAASVTMPGYWSMAFPCLFYQSAEDCNHAGLLDDISFQVWVQMRICFHDGRFSRHPYWKIIANNISAKRSVSDTSQNAYFDSNSFHSELMD